MNYLATGLALAVVHIEKRSDACSEDDDVRALEEIVGHLSDAPTADMEDLRIAFSALGLSGMIDGIGLKSAEN